MNNILIVTERVAGLQITASLSSKILIGGEVIPEQTAKRIISDEFDKDITLALNARRIFNALQLRNDLCYEVSITGKGLNFIVIAK